MSMSTSSTVEAEIAALRRRLEAAQRSRIRAEHERDAAVAAADAARVQLQEEFGVFTTDEAQQLLAELEAEVAAQLKELNQLLTHLGV